MANNGPLEPKNQKEPTFRDTNILNLRGYGMPERAGTDGATLTAIIERQGLTFVVDVLADFVGKSVLKFKLNESEAYRFRVSIENDLHNAISERI